MIDVITITTIIIILFTVATISSTTIGDDFVRVIAYFISSCLIRFICISSITMIIIDMMTRHECNSYSSFLHSITITMFLFIIIIINTIINQSMIFREQVIG